MKVCLLVAREPGTTNTAWVADAADEYTMDDWSGALPEPLQKLVDADPANHRLLWVEIPDGTLERLWDTPTITGTLAT